jgi:hypothetical protein
VTPRFVEIAVYPWTCWFLNIKIAGATETIPNVNATNMGINLLLKIARLQIRKNANARRIILGCMKVDRAKAKEAISISHVSKE